MPVQPRPSDNFTRDNLLLGFSVIEFTPTGSSVPVPMGILSGEALQKQIESLELENGAAGTLTVDREIISKLSVNMNLELFNFSSNVAQYIFGAESLVSNPADATAPGNTDVQLDGTFPFSVFYDLDDADINEASVEVTFNAITLETVGTGDGALNAFRLNQKVKAVGDITAITVGGVAYTPVAFGAAVAGNEVEVIIGETDGAAPTGSGSLEFFVGGVSTPPTVGQAIVCDYQPSFSTTGTDIVNLTDFTMDIALGKIRFLDPAGIDNSPFRPEGDTAVGLTVLNVDYTFASNASTTMQPFTKLTFDGKLVIRHLPDIGVNFIWTIPSSTIKITDDDLTFGADDFATATLSVNVNDAGGSQRFGTLELSSESQSA